MRAVQPLGVTPALSEARTLQSKCVANTHRNTTALTEIPQMGGFGLLVATIGWASQKSEVRVMDVHCYRHVAV